MRRRLRLRRPGALGIQVLGVIGAALLVASTTVFSLSVVQGRAESANTLAQAQVHSNAVLENADDILHTFLAAEVPSSTTPKSSETFASGSIPAALAADTAVALRELEVSAIDLHATLGTAESLELLGASQNARVLFDVYLEEPATSNYLAFQGRLDTLRSLVDELQPKLAAALLEEEHRILSITSWARNAVIAGVVIAGMFVGLTTWIIGVRLNRALATATREKSALIDSTAAMLRRNEQFRALYHVVTEVTETLSLDYVVQTTIREARSLVRADVAVLRLLKGDQLVIAGTAQDVDGDVANLGDIALGVGLVGRAAKRGRTLRIDEDAELHSESGERILGVQSGVIVPLIVGARVVGSLACWSRRPYLFTSDDEQVLEMMGSQVATAVVAASTHEASERDAHHDALTGVPNRRQLNRDIVERFHPALADGRSIAIAMVDIDHFKRFNDDFGHKIGDVTLQKVAEVLVHSVRAGDSVYRYGGEEFTIVFADTTPEAALALMDRVRSAVERTPLTGQSGEPVGPVTISAGVVGGPGNGVDCEALLRFADDALYQSKWSGRNRVTIVRRHYPRDPLAGCLRPRGS